MTKQKNGGSAKPQHSSTMGDQLRVIGMKKSMAGIQKAFGTSARMPTVVVPKDGLGGLNWEDLEGLYLTYAETIMTHIEAVDTTVLMVQEAGGLENYAEFKTSVDTTNKDFARFVQELNIIHDAHKVNGSLKRGPACSPEDLMEVAAIYERYNQWQAFFLGVAHHTQVAFTDYALQANDRMELREHLQKEIDEAGIQAAPASSNNNDLAQGAEK